VEVYFHGFLTSAHYVENSTNSNLVSQLQIGKKFDTCYTARSAWHKNRVELKLLEFPLCLSCEMLFTVFLTTRVHHKDQICWTAMTSSFWLFTEASLVLNILQCGQCNESARGSCVLTPEPPLNFLFFCVYFWAGGGWFYFRRCQSLDYLESVACIAVATQRSWHGGLYQNRFWSTAL
jgi:hypothetical protein